MALDTIDLHGQVLSPVTLTPAVGTVTFKILQELRDTADNIVYSPQTFVATLDVNGEFTITLPVTDDPTVTPADWSYWVYVDTDIWVSGVFYVQLPTALGPVAEFADLIEMFPVGSDCTPDGTACAPVSLVGEVAELEAAVAALETDVATLQGDVTDLTSDVAALVISVGNLASDVSTLQGDVGILQGQMTTAQADIASLQVTTAALVGQVNTITPIVLQNEADIATLITDVTNLQGQVAALQGQVTTILANAGLIDPTTFVNLTNLNANIVLGAVPAASRLDRGGDPGRLRGFLTATAPVAGSTVLANIGVVANRPLHAVSMGVRYSGGSTRLQISTGGDLTIAAALALNDQVWLDGTTFDKIA